MTARLCCRRAQVIRMKKILLVTSVYTGAGHQSISDALVEQFSLMTDVEVKVLEGFELLGSAGRFFPRLYGVTTRHVPALYNAYWRFTMKHPPSFAVTTRLCRRRFTEAVRSFHPDLILSVHSCFNTLLTRMLESLGLNIPVAVLQADLVNIHSTWCNPRARMTICPTREAYEASLLQGMPPEKMKIEGFPVRSRFCDAANEADAREYLPSRPLRCLMMSGGEGTGRLKVYAESILRHTDAELTVICGRNGKLRNRLRKSLGAQYGSRIRVLEFVSAPEREMLRNDLLVTRSSPNILSEAVVMTIPFIMIGTMPEQEKGNAELMQKYRLGIISHTPGDVPQIIRDLLSDNAAGLREIRTSQRGRRSFDNARNIAGYVAELAEPLEYTL